jgi:hypothetical protein
VGLLADNEAEVRTAAAGQLPGPFIFGIGRMNYEHLFFFKVSQSCWIERLSLRGSLRAFEISLKTRPSTLGQPLQTNSQV